MSESVCSFGPKESKASSAPGNYVLFPVHGALNEGGTGERETEDSGKRQLYGGEGRGIYASVE